MPDRSSRGYAAQEVNYYLACFPARPIRLSRERPTTIGRADGNTIVLADSDVSRRHAVVEWRDGAFYIRDLGSRNGVLVNDVRVTESKLSPDDRIRIGSRVLTFLEGDEQAVRRLFLHRRQERQSGATDTIDAQTASRPPTNLSGTLADFGLGELLQALELGRKTGKVTVSASNARGELWLRDGQIVRARMGEYESEEAVYKMLALTEGRFEFESRPVDIEDEIRIKTASLLMEGFRRIDEAARREAAPPAAETALPGGPAAGDASTEPPAAGPEPDQPGTGG